tara:strand:+ start:1450 stop:3561 length:2112 start_codon:yes stop_codon:yes gene_type:complete
MAGAGLLRQLSAVVVFLLIWVIIIACQAVGQPVSREIDSDLSKIADKFIVNAEELLHMDIIMSIDEVEATITDETTRKNLEYIFLITHYYFSLENKDKLQEYSEILQKNATILEHHSFVRVAEIFKSFSVGLGGHYDTAINELKNHLESAINSNDELATIIAYHTLMGLEPLEGEFYSALIYAEKANEIIKSTRYESQMWLHHYNSLTYLYTELEDLENALIAANKSLKIVRDKGLYADVSTLIYNIGISLQFKKYYAMSDRLFDVLIAFYDRTGQENMNLYSYYGKALIYHDLEQPTKTLEYVYKALEYKDTDESFATSVLQLGAEQLADQGDIETAKLYREGIQDYFDKYPEFKNSFWDNLNLKIDSKIAYAEKRYEDAFHLMEQYNKVSSIELEKSTSNDIMNIRSSFSTTLRTEQLEKELLLEKQQMQLQQMILIVAGFSVILILLTYLLLLQRRNSEKLRKSKLEAEAANSSKSEFLANMSHEIRTPLNAVIGFAEALEMGVGADDKEKRNESLKIIANSGRKLNNLISDILDFSKIEAGKFELNLEPVYPGDIFKKNLPIIRDLAEKGDVTFQGIRNSDKKVLVDRNRLDQILLNFITNAIKYNRPNGSIEFGCFDSDNGMLRIYVKDSGIGIPKNKEIHLFTPFDRLEPSDIASSGIGLGLFICKKLTESMGGIIGYTSEVDKGTTFWVEFPSIVE